MENLTLKALRIRGVFCFFILFNSSLVSGAEMCRFFAMKYLVIYYDKLGYVKKFKTNTLKTIINIVKSMPNADVSRGVKITKI